MKHYNWFIKTEVRGQQKPFGDITYKSRTRAREARELLEELYPWARFRKDINKQHNTLKKELNMEKIIIIG